jgi:hypothetical protein
VGIGSPFLLEKTFRNGQRLSRLKYSKQPYCGSGSDLPFYSGAFDFLFEIVLLH